MNDIVNGKAVADEVLKGAEVSATAAKASVVSKVMDLLHTAEADVAADEAKLLAWFKAEAHQL